MISRTISSRYTRLVLFGAAVLAASYTPPDDTGDGHQVIPEAFELLNRLAPRQD